MDKEIIDTTKLDNLAVDPAAIYEKPPYLMQIGKGQFFSRGDFSVIKGKQKSRKSFLSTYFCIDMLRGVYANMKRIENISGIAYIDTEQSIYYVWLIAKRLQKFGKNFKVYTLRKYEPDERMAYIERIIYENDYDFLVIDGIRDLVWDINSQEEATKAVSKLLKWTQENNCHILNIIHENKGDGNSRGHIGTELQNKCETVIKVEEDLEDQGKSNISCAFTRTPRRFDDFAIRIEEGLPVLDGDENDLIPF